MMDNKKILNNVVVQHNNLINAKYKMSLNEKRLVLCVVSKINPKEEINGDLIIELELKEIFDIFESNKQNYSYFRELANNLRKKDFPIQRLEDGRIMKVGWFSRILDDEQGMLQIKIDEKIIPYLIQLKEYTQYKLESVLKFKNVHTFRVFELVKQYEKLKKRTIEIEEFKEILGIDGKYPRIIDLKRAVLDKTKEEINRFSDIQIDYELIKKGKKYKYITYEIKSKKVQDKEKIIKENTEDAILKVKIESIMEIIKEEITYDDAKSIYNAAGGDIGKIVEKYFMSKGKNIGNIVGYIIKALEENYSQVCATTENAYNPHANKFHNFKQRTDNYTAEELEEIVLENQRRKFEQDGRK